MFIKTTVYLDREDLTALEITLLNEGKGSNISSLLRGWIKSYLKKSSYIPNDIKVSTIISTRPESAIESMKKETKEFISKVKKSETCPHMISLGGICRSCPGGLAK